jgi:hypothetical protein
MKLRSPCSEVLVRRFIGPLLSLGTIILALLTFSSIRAHEVAVEAAKYAPAPRTPVLIPAGTNIQAVVRHGVAESAGPGSSVNAAVPSSIVVGGRTVIPSGAELTGKLEKVSFLKFGADARMNFDVLLFGGRAFIIRSKSVELTVPVQSDIDLMGNAIRGLMGASIGAATGAAAGDMRFMDWAVLQSAVVSESGEVAIPITVTLTQDLQLKT